MFTIAIEGEGGDFPIVRLVPDRKTARRSGSFGPLRTTVRCWASCYGRRPCAVV